MNENATRQGYSHQREVERTQLRADALRHAVNLGGGSESNVLHCAKAFEAFLQGDSGEADPPPEAKGPAPQEMKAALDLLHERRSRLIAAIFDGEKVAKAHLANEEDERERIRVQAGRLAEVDRALTVLTGNLVRTNLPKDIMGEAQAQGEQATDSCAQAPQRVTAEDFDRAHDNARRKAGLEPQATPGTPMPVVHHIMTLGGMVHISEDTLVESLRAAGFMVTKRCG